MYEFWTAPLNGLLEHYDYYSQESLGILCITLILPAVVPVVHRLSSELTLPQDRNSHNAPHLIIGSSFTNHIFISCSSSLEF